jgi:2-keto-3-deoxy-L-rhamnonate aldolase RhmA
MDLIFTSNNPAHATLAEAAGVRRVMVDLERLGKSERQGHLDTWMSAHCMSDIEMMRGALAGSELMVRINPLHDHTEDEIAHCTRAGVDVVMLPMFTSEGEVRSFIAMLGSSTRASLLVETPQALARLEHILAVDGIGEVHVGLNDLHLGMKLNFMFELLSGGLIEHCARSVTGAGLPFGFGGIAPVGEGLVPAELIAAEHVRLGSEQVFLSRAFSRLLESGEDWSHRSRQFRDQISALLACFKGAAELDASTLGALHLTLRDQVSAIARGRP